LQNQELSELRIAAKREGKNHPEGCTAANTNADIAMKQVRLLLFKVWVWFGPSA
jgi:hypothetical protein